MRFNIATEREILSGKISDVYFKRALKALRLSGEDQEVAVEVSAQTLPEGFGWGVFAGLDEVIQILKGKKCDLTSLPEGSLFSARDPVLTLRARYGDIAVLETAILGFLSQASGIATKAAHFRLCSQGKTLLSFGARRMHPAIAPFIDRAAYIGGFDGVAVIASAERLGIKPSGTMPHSLIILVGDTVKAFNWFDEAVDKDVPRIALVDTFGDEKVETLRLAREAGRKLSGIRIDTPNSRRGNVMEVAEEIRWELGLIGADHVKIFVSGGLDLREVEKLAPVVDGFGIGTSLSNARVVNFAMDIVQVGREPITKKGKMSGAKEITMCSSCRRRAVLVRGVHSFQCTCGGKMRSLFKRYLKNGEETYKSYPRPSRIRSHLLQSLLNFTGNRG